jgi:hypothetical protein
MKNRILDAATLKSRRTTDTDAKLDSPQVLLAGQDGTIYIMIDFEVSSLSRDNEN